jgi:hypothetical protein
MHMPETTQRTPTLCVTPEKWRSRHPEGGHERTRVLRQWQFCPAWNEPVLEVSGYEIDVLK